MSTCPYPLRIAVRGFTLLEVLIAVIVLSVGLLGMAGLNALSLRLGQGAQQRTHASHLAYEIGDAMRANAGYAGRYLGTHVKDCETDFIRFEGTDRDNIIEAELDEWKNRLACQLTEGQALVAENDTNEEEEANPNNLYRITICWNHQREENENIEQDKFCADNNLAGTIHFTYITFL